MKPWIYSIVPEGSDFGLDNLPWGVYKDGDGKCTICVAVGTHVLDVRTWATNSRSPDGGSWSSDIQAALSWHNLNPFLEQPHQVWAEARNSIRATLLAYDPVKGSTAVSLRPMSELTMVLPIAIGDYTDFYCSREHATNVGAMFRGRDNALQPNWLHLPVGYHGRASSIVVSGAAVKRPWGQVQGETEPECRPSSAMDYEVEMACVIGRSTESGRAVSLAQAAEHIFGFMLLNDLSARDIQKWEYVPLGPFNGKNFATVVSPWIVQREALMFCACEPPEQTPTPLPYLSRPGPGLAYDVVMEASIKPAGCPHTFTTCRSNLRDLYWTFEQMVAHHTLGGCNLRAGDLIASGTVSSAGEGRQGCLLECTLNGKQPLTLEPGLERAWLHDGDVVELRAWCERGECRVGFGSCQMTLLPAAEWLPG